MIQIELTSRFIKRAKRLSEKDKLILSEKTDLFKQNPNDSKLKVHPLTGKLKGYMAFLVTRGKRVKFVWLEKSKVMFVDVGSHDDVY